jgi:hypothetical protein
MSAICDLCFLMDARYVKWSQTSVIENKLKTWRIFRDFSLNLNFKSTERKKSNLRTEIDRRSTTYDIEPLPLLLRYRPHS